MSSVADCAECVDLVGSDDRVLLELAHRWHLDHPDGIISPEELASMAAYTGGSDRYRDAD
jgi:hypothetical protein